MIDINSKLNGVAIVLLDGENIDDLSNRQIKSKLAALSPAIKQLQHNNVQFHSLKNKIQTLKANLDNTKLSDADFRDFVKTLF